MTAVIHFSTRKQVGESVQTPRWYYQQNISEYDAFSSQWRTPESTR